MRWFAVLAALALATGAAAQQIEKRDVHIAVGGKSALYYLPLVLTERLNYYKDEGLNVRISDFAGGTRSLEAVVGIFEAGRERHFDQLVYPTMVMLAAVVALVGLGAFQFLSRRSQREAAAGADDADADPSEQR